MPLRNRVGASSGGGGNSIKINGTVSTFTVASGYTVAVGDFVEYASNTVKPFIYDKTGTQVIKGVAKTGGSGGSSIQVYVPV